MGAIIGVMLTGIAADNWLQNKRFIMILILNILLYVMDIYLFASANRTQKLSNSGENTFSTFLGAVLCSSDLIYLILMPMLIAKNHSDKMS